MKAMTLVFWALAALLLLPVAAPAWSGAGHQVIAAEAYRELSPALQKKVLQVLKAHPQYRQWEDSFRGEAGNPEFGLQIFMRASTWPDEIRHAESKYGHPKWHFINYPLKPSRFPFVPDSSPENDILFAIQQCEQNLSNRKASPEEHAVCLSWLIHLIGDLHQPLHCSSLFDSAHPNGDKGGNDFFVKPAAQGIPLHSFWDGLLGTSGKAQSHLNYAIALQSEHPRKSLKPLKKARTAKDWSLESRSLAVESVYLHGRLKGGINREAAPDLPSGYTKAAKAVAETQAALAGYRLADEIRKWMK
jgi:hypothetical protein